MEDRLELLLGFRSSAPVIVRDCVSHGFKDAPSFNGELELLEILEGILDRCGDGQYNFLDRSKIA